MDPAAALGTGFPATAFGPLLVEPVDMEATEHRWPAARSLDDPEHSGSLGS